MWVENESRTDWVYCIVRHHYCVWQSCHTGTWHYLEWGYFSLCLRLKTSFDNSSLTPNAYLTSAYNKSHRVQCITWPAPISVGLSAASRASPFAWHSSRARTVYSWLMIPKTSARISCIYFNSFLSRVPIYIPMSVYWACSTSYLKWQLH